MKANMKKGAKISPRPSFWKFWDLKKKPQEKKKESAKTKGKKKIKFDRRRAALVFGVLAGLLVLIVGFYIYMRVFDDQILPNVKVGLVPVGGLSVDAAAKKLEEVGKKNITEKIKLHINDKNFEESVENLGLNYDYKTSAQKAYKLGHNHSKIKNIYLSARAIFGPIYLLPELTGGKEQVKSWVQTIALEIDDPLQNANLEVRDGIAYVIEPKDGKQIDQAETVSRIINTFSNFTPPDLTLERKATYPQISKQDAEELADKAKELVKDSLVLLIDEEKFTILPGILGEWIELKVKGDGRNGEKYISFSADKIATYLKDNIAPSVNRQPRDAKFSFSGGSISVIQDSVSGASLNSEKASRGIVELLEDISRERKMEVSLDEEKAKINEEVVNNVAKYGIREQIGSATTSFGNSPQNRIHNIKTGAGLLNGILIAPGEEFSTIGHLGSISGASGFLPELVIKEDRTVPEFGGGLCQVSTTLFRAALNAGLKITERTNHSYRVSYYEPPIGMDATIYSPKPDLKFINNTPNHILVQSGVSGNSITFNFYGTSDGRRVEISNPEKYDETPPGETIYVEDPSMEPGTEKYLEHGHAGAKAVFYYKVYSANGGLKLEQTFQSVYVPWPARIVRGPEKPPEEAGGEQPPAQ